MTTHLAQQSRYFETYTERPDPSGLPRSASKLKVVLKSPKRHDEPRKEQPKSSSVPSKTLAPDGKTLLHSGSTKLVPVSGPSRIPPYTDPLDFPHTQESDSPSLDAAKTASESPLVNTPSLANRTPTLHRSSSSPSVSATSLGTSLHCSSRDVERLDGSQLPKGNRKSRRAPDIQIDNSFTSAETIPTIEDIMRKHKGASFAALVEPVPAIPAKFKIPGDRILSIDEIIKYNKASLQPARPSMRAGSAPPDLQPDGRRKRITTADSELSQARSSIDSITDEALSSLSATSSRETGRSDTKPTLRTPIAKRQDRQRSISSTSSSRSISNSRAFSDTNDTPAHTASEDTMRYLRSARLTRLIRLSRPPNHHLSVSLADVGLDTGHPVLVCLGLGCVRYLVALYDELAAALGLRLICIDRWGLGRSDDVSEGQRSFAAWAIVVEEVLEQLQITTCSVIAHSAGAPYALASSTRLENRIHGSIHLLAPWIVNPAENSNANYKWLKYVPSGVLKAAHTAEWKVQGWKLGKSPVSQPGGLGFNPRAPISSDMVSPVLTSFPTEISDDEGDVSFRSPSPTPTRTSDRTSASTNTRGTSTPTTGRHGHFNSPNPTASKDEKGLVTALLRASHSESLRGSTADLLCMLNRSSNANIIHYNEITQPIKVWHGSRDEKITLASVKALETLVSRCEIKVVLGADHSLMTNVPVFTEALRSIAKELL